MRKIVFVLMFILSLIQLDGLALASEAGTRENPLPIGSLLDLGDGWEIKILESYPNATQMILNENPFNIPPEQGNQFFMATIEAKNSGEIEKSFWHYRLHAVGASLIGYEPTMVKCVVPNGLPVEEVFPDGVIKGNIYWEINSSDANSLVLYDNKAEPGYRVFLSLIY